ncbi:hypothetical protein [Methylobacterium sp. A54F]
MRKHVTPADPAATIPDPERGVALPAAGLPVTWSAHWAALAERGDVTTCDLPDNEPDASTGVPAPAEAPVEPEPEPASSRRSRGAPVEPAA